MATLVNRKKASSSGGGAEAAAAAANPDKDIFEDEDEEGAK